jgi:hypothetical protein
MTLAKPTAKSVVDALNLGDVVTLNQDEVVLQTERDASNGFAGLNADGALEAVVQVRNGSAAEIDDLVLLDGELAIITDGDLPLLSLGDGISEGGVPLSQDGWMFATKPTITEVVSSTALTADPHLSFSGLTPGDQYEFAVFQAVVNITAIGTGGFKGRVVSGTQACYGVYIVDSIFNATLNIVSAVDWSIAPNGQDATAIRITARGVTTIGASGTITLEWAQHTSSANPTRMASATDSTPPPYFMIRRIGGLVPSNRAIMELSDQVVLETERDAPNGFAGLNGDGAIEAVLQVRSGDAATVNSLVLLDDELAIVTEGGNPIELRVGDGTTAGGKLIMSGWKVVEKPVATERSNTTTLAEDPHLVFTGLTEGDRYEFLFTISARGQVQLQESGAGGLILSIRSGASVFGFGTYFAEYVPLTPGGSNTGSTQLSLAVNGGPQTRLIYGSAHGVIGVAAGQTSIGVWWAQHTASADPTRLNAFCRLYLRKLP